MKWKVEVITEDSNNILVDVPEINDYEKEPVGMGFPLKLAQRIVKIHNESLQKIIDIIETAPHEESCTHLSVGQGDKCTCFKDLTPLGYENICPVCRQNPVSQNCSGYCWSCRAETDD